MNTALLPRLAFALPLVLASSLPDASSVNATAVTPPVPVGWVIAQQGNRALQVIKDEAGRLPAPTLPPRSVVEAR